MFARFLVHVSVSETNTALPVCGFPWVTSHQVHNELVAPLFEGQTEVRTFLRNFGTCQTTSCHGQEDSTVTPP